jgi:hypothetical protein
MCASHILTHEHDPTRQVSTCFVLMTIRSSKLFIRIAQLVLSTTRLLVLLHTPVGPNPLHIPALMTSVQVVPFPSTLRHALDRTGCNCGPRCMSRSTGAHPMYQCADDSGPLTAADSTTDLWSSDARGDAADKTGWADTVLTFVPGLLI